MRKWLKIILIFFLGIVLGGILIPFIYKGKVLSLVKKEFEKQVNGTLEFSDLNLSVFKRFPLINCRIEDIVITGKGPFVQTPFFTAQSLDLSFDLIKILQTRFKQFELKKIKLSTPELSLITRRDGLFNLKDILKQNDKQETVETTPSNFKALLETIDITEGRLRYNDSSALTFADLSHLQHHSSGTYDNSELALTQSSTWDSLNFNSAGIQYIKDTKGSWKGKLNYQVDSSIFTLTKDQIALNALVLELMGRLKINSSGFSEWDFDFAAPQTDLKQFISMIPGAYQHHFSSIQTDGNFVLNGGVHGIYDSTGRKPYIRLNTEIKNGRVKYDHLPYPIDKIHLVVQLSSLDSFFNAFDVKIPQYALTVQNNPLSGNIHVRTGSAIDVEGSTKGNINLHDLNRALPIDSLDMSGLVAIDVLFGFTDDLIVQKKYDQMKLVGTFKADKIQVKYHGYPTLRIDSLTTSLNPAITKISLQSALYGRSDFKGNVEITNALAFASAHKELAGVMIQTSSNRIDIDEINSGGSPNTTNPSLPSTQNDLATVLNLRFKSTAQQVNYKDYDISGVSTSGQYIKDSLVLNPSMITMNGSPLSITGTLIHPYLWNTGQQLLTGNLTIQSDRFNLDPWMADADIGAALPSLDTQFIKHLPERTDLLIQAKIRQALYGAMVFKNLVIDSKLTNQSFEIHNSSGTLFNGTVNLTGLYQETGTLPGYNFKIDLAKLKIEDIFKSSKVVASLAPLAGFVEGVFSSSMILEGKLNAKMEPVMDAFDASGVLETFNGLLSKFKPLEDLAQKIQIPVLNFFKWDKSKNWFNIDKGTVTINPFTIRYGEIPIQISGQHRLDQMMNYNLILNIPKKVFEKYKVGVLANESLEWLRKEAASKGLNLSGLDTIYVLLNVQGKISQPSTKITWLNDPYGKSKMDQIKDDIGNSIKTKLDSIEKMAEDKAEATKDSIINIIQKQIDLKKEQIDSVSIVIRDSLKKLAEKKTQKILDSVIKKETTKILDSTLQSKVDTLLGTKTKEEIEKINEKLKNWNPFKKKPIPAKN